MLARMFSAERVALRIDDRDRLAILDRGCGRQRCSDGMFEASTETMV
jgi:hypothetical protein